MKPATSFSTAGVMSLPYRGVPVEDLTDCLVGVHVGSIQQVCPFGRFEGCYRTVGIARVTFSQILKKVGHVSSKAFLNQLLISPFRTGRNACGQENFELCMGKYHGAHVASVGHQSGRFAEAELQADQR